MTGDSIKKRKSASIQVVSFRIGKEHFAVPVWQVGEIIREVELFDVPGGSERIRGIINLRGEIIPIVRMDLILGMSDAGIGDAHHMKRLIIVDVDSGKFGFEVNEVLDVMRISTGEVQPPPLLSPENALSGVIIGIIQLKGKMVVCLDAETVLKDRVTMEEVMTV